MKQSPTHHRFWLDQPGHEIHAVIHHHPNVQQFNIIIIMLPIKP
jgi:hypothetical protein